MLQEGLKQIQAKELTREKIAQLYRTHIDDVPFFGKAWKLNQELRDLESWYLAKFQANINRVSIHTTKPLNV